MDAMVVPDGSKVAGLRERSEPAEGGGGAVAKRAAGARPPLFVLPHVRHGRRRRLEGRATTRAERARRRRRGTGREASRGGKAPFVRRASQARTPPGEQQNGDERPA